MASRPSNCSAGVEALELLRGGEAGLAVEGEDGDSGAGVDGLSFDVLASVGIAPDPVLWTEEGDQLHPGDAVQDVDGGVEVAVHAGGIGHQPDALALQLRETIGLKDIDAGADPLCLCRADKGEKGHQYYGGKSVFHICLYLTEIEAVSGVVEFLGVEEDEAAAGELAAE